MTNLPETERERAVRTSTGVLAALVLWAAFLVTTGCGAGDAARTGAELLLQPAATRGPDPFTTSTALSTATPAPLPRTPRTAAAPAPAAGAPAALTGLRSLSGGTPGLYGGSERSPSCDVQRQTALLVGDPARSGAFAQAMGVAPEQLSAYLHSLTPVVLRADTRVTDHGYRHGRARDRQAVLQAGTAVLVDERGLPRVRCACGNPLTPPLALPGDAATEGRPWPGYRPSEVVVVTRAPRVMGGLTLLDADDRTWIERRIGHAVQHDHVLPPPDAPRPVAPRSVHPAPKPSTPLPAGSVLGWSPEPADTPEPPAPSDTPDATLAPVSPRPTDETGPEAVPDAPDLPDGGGLVPDAPDAPEDEDDGPAEDDIGTE
ncbi:DUF6777 domain-containing protein [Streptomyces broussonetiae]|uniref:DUF6777 domain-containing protein n=1 Tax=Streptomyces broussonetiae TaxID=2686304 RepID=A0ABV5ECY3_9ACTN